MDPEEVDQPHLYPRYIICWLFHCDLYAYNAERINLIFVQGI